MFTNKIFLFIVLVILVFLLSVLMSRAAEDKKLNAKEIDRQWYAFMVDDSCVEVNAESLDHAYCVMKHLEKERGYTVYTHLSNGCPGINADDYFYDFTFNCKKTVDKQ